MQKQTLIIFALLAVIIVGGLFGKLEYNERDRSHEIELKRAGEALKRRDKQIRLLLDSLAKQDLIALQAIQEERLRADRAEAKLSGALKRHENTRIIRTTSDKQRDSLIRAVLHN